MGSGDGLEVRTELELHSWEDSSRVAGSLAVLSPRWLPVFFRRNLVQVQTANGTLRPRPTR